MKVPVLNIKGKTTGREVELSKKVFGIDPNDHAVYLDVKQFLANQRQGNAKTKLVEFKGFEEELKIGDTINVSHFVEGEFVDVSGISKGKGFQGVVKRHGFAGVGQSTHGQHNRLRAPGSIGAASYPARVFKGMRMAGQTGNSKVTVQNLKVLKVVPEKNLLVLKGAVPGHKNSFVIIRK